MSARGQRILITGGAGFIGSHLCERLAPDNEVVVFDNLSRDSLSLAAEAVRVRVSVIRGNIQDAQALATAAQGCDLVIHCAAIAGVYSVGRSPYETIRTNLFGTINALEAASSAGARHFVDFSTSEVYGPFVYRGEESGLTSSGPAHDKRWTYAVSKLAGEHITYAYSVETGLPVTSVRPFNIYGPRQMGEGAVREMALRAVRNEPIVLHNDGTQIRAWCHVSDLVDCMTTILDNTDAHRRTFNIGNPRGATTNIQLAETIRRLAGSSSSLVFAPHPGPEVEVRIPNIDLAARTLGFSPRVGLEEGLAETIAWYAEHAR
jgi:nucleoside-diphosphate-sugar epimerase